MISEEEVGEIVFGHDSWVEQMRPRWNKIRGAFADEFWQSGAVFPYPSKSEITGNDLNYAQVQINLVKPWVNSFLASLFYKGLRTQAEPDQLANEEILDADQISAVQYVVDRFYATEEVADVAEQAYEMALMYAGGCAIKLGVRGDDDLPENDSPFNRIWSSVLPPWEAVWDRRNPTRRAARYIGHLYQDSIERVRARYPKVDDTELEILHDVVRVGMRNRESNTNTQHQRKYVRILELYDLTAQHLVEGEDEPSDGEMRIYLVSGYGGSSVGAKNAVGVERLHKGPIGQNWPNGRPAVPIEPVILENLPEYPMDGLAPAQSIYELNAELNLVATRMANAYRRDAARVLMYLRDRGIDEKVLSAIESGQDMVTVGVDAGTLDGAFKYLEQQAVNDTIHKYRAQIIEGLERVQLTADLTRGTQAKYASATEINFLNAYTETTIGRIRRRMDRAISHVGALYLTMLVEEMRDGKVKKVSILVGTDKVDVDVDVLGRQWHLFLSEAANTPIAEQAQRAEFVEVQDKLMQLAVAAQAGGPAGAMAQEQIDYFVQLYDLPRNMSWSHVGTVAPPPPEAPAEQAPIEPLPPTPDEMARSPVAQAIVSAAEQPII